ncbi:MAG: CRTAC1 family protein, partial [Acidobacteriota bacterium]
QPPTAFEQSDETRRMVERLDRLTTDTERFQNPFENAVRVEHFQAQPTPRTFGARLDADLRLAREQLRAGDTRDAIASLDTLRANLGDGIDATFDRDLRHLLGIAHLRLGEQENCLEHHHATSCLFPIGEEGRHQLRAGSERAMELYAELLDDDPSDLSALWLYNLAAMTLGAYPDDLPSAWRVDPATFASESSLPRFADTAMHTGTAADGLAGGVVLDDLDGDGHLDLMVSSWGVRDPIRLLRNTGDGTFEDRTEAAGLEGLVGGLNLIHADYDNDGDVDVLVLRGAWLGQHGRHPNSLLANRGDGTFDDVTESAGLLSFAPTQAAAWADFDRDGDLDLFIGNESARGSFPSELYRNRGDGTFVEVARASGLAIETFVKGVTWGDIDNDGWPDLYVSTMGGANLLFRNLGTGGERGWDFEEIGRRAGVAEPFDGFPTWFWDYDNDGWEDLLAFGYGASYLEPVAHQVAADYLDTASVSVPRLYRNRGDGTFEDVTEATALDRSLMAMGCNFGDLDNDGFLDVYVGTGAPNFIALAPNRMFRNRAGERFDDVTTAGGFGHLQKGHGVAFGDWDHDGDQDVYAVMGGAFSGDNYPNAFFDNPGNANRWITLRLEGTKSNRSAIGARIHVRVRTADGTRDLYTTVSTGGSFGSQSLQQEIGLGAAEAIESLTVTWPMGATLSSADAEQAIERFSEVTMDRIYRLREGTGALEPLDLAILTGSPSTHAH